jgi:hypothetical protein
LPGVGEHAGLRFADRGRTCHRHAAAKSWLHEQIPGVRLTQDATPGELSLVCMAESRPFFSARRRKEVVVDQSVAARLDAPGAEVQENAS